jgi:hypothetical protein
MDTSGTDRSEISGALIASDDANSRSRGKPKLEKPVTALPHCSLPVPFFSSLPGARMPRKSLVTSLESVKDNALKPGAEDFNVGCGAFKGKYG